MYSAGMGRGCVDRLDRFEGDLKMFFRKLGILGQFCSCLTETGLSSLFSSDPYDLSVCLCLIMVGERMTRGNVRKDPTALVPMRADSGFGQR